MNKSMAYGFLHCHSEHSLKDSPLKIHDLCKRAGEMGAKAVALTDHGSCTGMIEFMQCCDHYQINGIPGVEAYVKTEHSDAAHLILYAKNYAGYQEISEAVTKSNRHLQEIDGITVPVMDKNLLSTCFGQGNVIATSACVSGVLSCILLSNQCKKEKTTQLKATLSDISSPYAKSYVKNKELLGELEKKIAAEAIQKDLLECLAKKTYTKRLKGLESIRTSEPESYEKIKQKLDQEMEESKQAASELMDLKRRLTADRRMKTILGKKVREAEKEHATYYEIEEKLQQLKKDVLSDEELLSCTEKELLWFRDLFGDDFYVELQNHGLPDEAYVMPILASLAKKHGVPMVATNDVHIRDKGQVGARQFMHSLRDETWEPVSNPEEQYTMKSDAELYEAMLQIVEEEIAKESIRNIRSLCNQCHVVIPKESHYPKYKDGNVASDTADLLRKEVYKNIAKRYPNGLSPEHRNRLEYELNTIIELGYADYTLIVADYIHYARELSSSNGDGIGYGVGPGRGSGAGCMVNYLLGITSIDPLKYGLIFERYLNRERVTMPDIDTDFSDEVREDVISYVEKKYGEETVACIRTVDKQGARGSIRNSARIRGYELFPGRDTDQTVKESRKPLKQIGDSIANDIPSTPKIQLSDCENVLEEKYGQDKNAKIIMERAKSVEGIITSLSIHAAGVIIGDGAPLHRYVPLLYNTVKKKWAVQCDMNEAEAIGLQKMDFLGLNNLDIITDCIRTIRRTTGKIIQIESLPFEPEVFHEIFCKGKTNCVFQFESGGMKQMLREFQPECIEDIILLVAAYRPGPMDFIPDIIDVKFKRKRAEYIIPQLESILAPTYGKPIYQEQLMDIFHQCAGFTMGEADIIRRYMSKKKEKEFLSYKPQFIEGMVRSGATEEKAEQFWNMIQDFSKYAFNKSHAACYAMVAYQTAWLKYHYPAEFMCAVLKFTKKDLSALLYECKEMGIEILPPDVNASYSDFTLDGRGNILYGLNAIKGIGTCAKAMIKERQEHGLYASFLDFMLRVHPNKGVASNLIKAGAFDSCDVYSRFQLSSILEPCVKALSAIKKKSKDVEGLESSLNHVHDKTEASKIKKRLANAMEALERAKLRLADACPSRSLKDDRLEILREERELIGAYISGHPLDSYRSLFHDKNITLIQDAQAGKTLWFAGMISDIRLAKRKTDQKDMAFFTLEDVTGSISVNCFTAAYDLYHRHILEGNVVKILGRVTGKDLGPDDENGRELTIKQLLPCRPARPPILISVSDITAYMQVVRQKLNCFANDDGYPIILHERATGNLFDPDGNVLSHPLSGDERVLYLDRDILNTEIPEVFIKMLDIQ